MTLVTEKRLKFYLRDEEIFKYFFEVYTGQEFEVGIKFSSPLRDNDPTPSFLFKYLPNEKGDGYNLIFKDFGYDTERSDSIGFVSELLGLSRKHAVIEIWNQMILDRKVNISPIKVKRVKKMPYTPYYRDIIGDSELKYWKHLDFNRAFLNFFNVKLLKKLKRVDKTVWEWDKSNPTYVYLYNIYIKAFKAYRPLAPNGDKFRGVNNGDVVECFEQLPRNGEHLFICSSSKDAMCLRLLGFLAIAPSSENSRKALVKMARHLNLRFKRIYILFDEDTAGHIATRNLHYLTNWTPIRSNFGWAKDLADSKKISGSYLPLMNFLTKFEEPKYNLNL